MRNTVTFTTTEEKEEFADLVRWFLMDTTDLESDDLYEIQDAILTVLDSYR